MLDFDCHVLQASAKSFAAILALLYYLAIVKVSLLFGDVLFHHDVKGIHLLQAALHLLSRVILLIENIRLKIDCFLQLFAFVLLFY